LLFVDDSFRFRSIISIKDEHVQTAALLQFRRRVIFVIVGSTSVVAGCVNNVTIVAYPTNNMIRSSVGMTQCFEQKHLCTIYVMMG
jgi:ribosomal protein L30/L7E